MHADVPWFMIMTLGSHFHGDRSVPKGAFFRNIMLVFFRSTIGGYVDGDDRYNTDMLFAVEIYV